MLVLVLSWLDMVVAGTKMHSLVPLSWHQPIHFSTFAVTAIIGYWNWKSYDQQWLLHVWIASYCAILGLVVIILGTSQLTTIDHRYIGLATHLRTIFLSPLPLLIFYIVGSSNKLHGRDGEKPVP